MDGMKPPIFTVIKDSMGNCLCCCLRDDLKLQVSSIYDIKMRDIYNEIVDFSQFRNRVLLIVNIACKCQLAGKNFNQLVTLDTQFKSKGLDILAFPCNQFFWREYGTAEQIIQYIRKKVVRFRVFEKVDVNGKNTCELYKFLRKKSKLDCTKIGLNFGKFLVDRNGMVFKYYGPLTDPIEITDDIRALL